MYIEIILIMAAILSLMRLSGQDTGPIEILVLAINVVFGYAVGTLVERVLLSKPRPHGNNITNNYEENHYHTYHNYSATGTEGIELRAEGRDGTAVSVRRIRRFDS